MIEHVMQAVMTLAEHVYVLTQGRMIAEGTPAAIARRPAGHRSLSRPRRRQGCRRMPEARCLRCAACAPATARSRSCAASTSTVGAGEIVALLGSNGAGKSTLNNNVSGLCRAARRRDPLRRRGDRPARRPTRIVAAGLIQVPEGRRIFPNLSVRENLELGSYRRGRAAGARNLERVFAIFPRLRERCDAARRHAVRRRAADAGDRPRPDGRAAAC